MESNVQNFMKEELFSIIIPTYKGYDTLGIAIQSIINQSYKNIEIIVSDDNFIDSTEQKLTENTINRFNNKTIKYLKNGHHNGSYARNRGLEIASGKYVAFLDDDDFFLSDYLENVVSTFNNNKDVDMIFCDVVKINEEGSFKKVSHPNINSLNLLLNDTEIGTGSNICIRRKIAKHNFFDERYQRHQDIEYVAKIMHSYKYFWLEKIEIVKYFNQTNNYPNAAQALKNQELLRNDMLNNNIVTKNDIYNLKSHQLHGLYRDLLAKNANYIDIKSIYNNMKEANCANFVDLIMLLFYRISKKLFNFVYLVYSKTFTSNIKNDSISKYLDYRNYLIKEVSKL